MRRATAMPSLRTKFLVLGRGETRQVQTITAQQIQQLPAGTSPLKAIENMPGVNFQSADPYGWYEWSTLITVRGFNQNRMGFTLDGVPLGDMTYGNHNGLHISRAIPTELVERVGCRRARARSPRPRRAISAARSSSSPPLPRAISPSMHRRRSGPTRPSARTSTSIRASSATAARDSASPRRIAPRRNGRAKVTRTFASTISSSRSR